MSLRPATRSFAAPILRAGARPLSSSAPRRAGHSEHGQEDAGAETHESFFSPAMRNTLIFTALFALSYPYLPSPSAGSASPSVSPDAFDATSTSKDAPLITRLLAAYTPSAKTWTERNDKHLELVKDAAEERLLFQEAERTRVWRWRNASAFEQASPHRIAVGSQADLSDLKVKRD